MTNTSIFRFLLCLLILSSCKTSQHQDQSPDFVQIFNGKNLDGWKGDRTYWRVEKDALVGEVTPSTLLQRNTFIIWEGGEPENFELKFEFRITPNGNSGINYRSEEISSLPFALKGYQGDIDGENNYTGMNYEERGRTTLAERSQKVELTTVATDSFNAYIKDNHWIAATVTGSTGSDDSLKAQINAPGSWNEYHIIADGNVLQHFINGTLMSEVTDNDARYARKKGLMGFQVHVGPPMKVEFKNIYLKHIP